MDSTTVWWITVLSAGGVVVGLAALGRGLLAYRSSIRVGDTSTSTISSLAAGEVRVSGVVEAAEITLVSLLQSAPSVYYRSSVGRGREVSPIESDGVVEERSVGFRVRDKTGSIRVFPRGARIDAPLRLDDETGSLGDEPASLALRTGPSSRGSEPDRASAIDALLRVRPAAGERSLGSSDSERRRHYREHRLEPGDSVTVVGRALPFSDLADPANADYDTEADLRADDFEVAADLAEARAAGLLTLDPAAAWGNAAIAGFGIGRPVSAPHLDAAANALPIASAEEAARVRDTFQIEPGTLVLASSTEVPLLIASGTPGAVVQRSRQALTIGLLGAVLAIGSAMIFAIMISGRIAG